MKRAWRVALLLAAAARGVLAHEVRPAYLELRERAPATYGVVWKVPARGPDQRLGISVAFPGSCTSATAARSAFAGNAFTDRWNVTCPGGLTGGTIAIRGLASTVTDVLVRLEHLDGATQVVRLMPSAPSFVVEGTPGRLRLALTYLRLGIEHILLGVDHLLFVLGLLLIVPDRWTLLKTVSAFTVAHSITLTAATLGYVDAPLPPLEAAIALSILFLGPEIIRRRRGETSLTIRHTWVVAFAFGLLHGFGFASGLAAIGLPRGDIPLALLLFNLGVEVGQLAFVALMSVPARGFRAGDVRWPRWVELAPAYVVGSLGALWTIQRTATLLSG